MASIEFLKERISKAEDKIAKKQGTIAKKQGWIEKRKANFANLTTENERYWATCEINNLEDDIIRLEKEIKEAQTALDGYKAQLAAEIEKANSRNVPAILEFLADWKVKVMNYYERTFPVYLHAKEERYAQNREYCEKVNYMIRDHAKREELRKTEREQEKQFRQMWSNFIKYDECDRFQKERLQKDLDRDAELKYDDIIERTNAICGTITDAAGLRVGLKGDLDGYVKGERGTAKVQTIGAGGYNIQCFHFRTLVHEMK